MYRRALRERNRWQMERVFTNIAHELLTPLTIMQASVDSLRGKEPKYIDDYNLIDLNIQRTVRLLQQILETSKSQAGELKLRVSHGDVMEYIYTTAMTTEPLMHKRGLQFSINCEPQSMLGWIDTDKLDKIIFNLLTNAAKYTDDKGRVELNVRTNDTYDSVIITVSDNGIGIPADKQKHLFERYYDGDYRLFKTMGTGLGLALTRDLVALNGGTIRCHSTEGEGTTFTVTLPISKSAFSEWQIDEKNKVTIPEPNLIVTDAMRRVKPQAAAEAAEPDEEAYKLLIVEDNAELLMLMEQLLKTKYHVWTAMNGSEAQKIVREHDLDLVVSDVMMPVMDGYELTAWLKNSADYSSLPIILLTAKRQEADREAALALGADEYIVKPFRMKDLMLRIDNIISNRQRVLSDFQKESLKTVEERVEEKATPENEFLKKAVDCVYSHLDDADFDREAFAHEMGASASTLYNKLRAVTGMNVTAFIRDIRIKEACRLAETEEGLRVSELAYRVGFRDPKYFATTFKKVKGVQPSEYIEKLKN